MTDTATGTDHHDAGDDRVSTTTKIRVSGLTKIFGTRTRAALDLVEQGRTQEEIAEQTGATVAVRDASLDIPEGRIFVLMGLSGSGKSTLLRCLNRLIEPTAGTVELDGEDVTAMSDKELRRVRREKLGMVFQHFGLWPHRSVRDNVAYGLEIAGVGEAERHERADEVIETVGLSGWGDARPGELSGGMQQRVGLARALAVDPDVLLMDEPFSALDPLVRREMQEELLDLQDRLHKTIVFVTHDLDEAIKLGSTMAIMRAGRIVQVGEPEAILRAPADEYVASFVEDVSPTRVLRARDVMYRPDDTLRPDHTPRVALRLLERQGLDAAPVVASSGQVLGMVSADATASAAGRDVGQLSQVAMTDAAIADPDTPLQDLIDQAADEPHPIVITDEHGRFAGLVPWVSIIRGLARDQDARGDGSRSSVEPEEVPASR